MGPLRACDSGRGAAALPLALSSEADVKKITSSPAVAHRGICRSGPLLGGLTGAASCWNAPQAVASTSGETEAGPNLSSEITSSYYLSSSHAAASSKNLSD